MKKLTLTIMIALLLIGTVSAGIGIGVLFNINPVTDFEKTQSIISNEKTLILTVDGKPIEIVTNEEEFDEGDIQSIIDKINGTVTLITFEGATWKENEYGDKSFDEDKLKELECGKEGLSFDSKSNDCVNEVVEVSL